MSVGPEEDGAVAALGRVTRASLLESLEADRPVLAPRISALYVPVARMLQQAARGGTGAVHTDPGLANALRNLQLALAHGTGPLAQGSALLHRAAREARESALRRRFESPDPGSPPHSGHMSPVLTQGTPGSFRSAPDLSRSMQLFSGGSIRDAQQAAAMAAIAEQAAFDPGASLIPLDELEESAASSSASGLTPRGMPGVPQTGDLGFGGPSRGVEVVAEPLLGPEVVAAMWDQLQRSLTDLGVIPEAARRLRVVCSGGDVYGEGQGDRMVSVWESICGVPSAGELQAAWKARKEWLHYGGSTSRIRRSLAACLCVQGALETVRTSPRLMSVVRGFNAQLDGTMRRLLWPVARHFLPAAGLEVQMAFAEELAKELKV